MTIQSKIEEGFKPSKPAANFHYCTDGYDSYRKNGREPPDHPYRSDRQEVEFPAAVDINKGKIKVNITRMFRIKAVDYSSEKQERKEYLIWESTWNAQKWTGVQLWIREHLEGKYAEQTTVKQEDIDMTNGRLVVTSKPGPPREVYFIPFTKQNVDKILKGEHPFGPDSINITDIDKVIFYGKFDDMPGFRGFRCNGYTYEQFVTPEWRQFLELGTRPGGPLGKAFAPENAGNEYYK